MLSNPRARRINQRNLSFLTLFLTFLPYGKFNLKRERKSPFPHCLNTYFSNFFLQKALNGFFARPWWKQWLLTSLLLHPSFPSLHHSWLISLSKWFLTPSFSFQPFRPWPGLVVGAMHCDRWNESPEKSHLLINPWGIQPVKKKYFSTFFLRHWQMEEEKKKSRYMKTIWGFSFIDS